MDSRNKSSVIQEILDTLDRDQSDPPWWRNLDGEVNQKKDGGRYLENTINGVLDPVAKSAESKHGYRGNWAQFFFSKGGRVDGRVADVGVEEKVKGLALGDLVDGALCRGLVWTLGKFPDEPRVGVGAVGLHVVKPHTKPMDFNLARLFATSVRAVRSANVYVFLINGETGERWPAGLDDDTPVPSWLASGSPYAQPLVEPDPTLFDTVDWSPPGRTLTEKLPGGRKRCWTDLGDRCAYAEWGNEWQMLDVGLLLRALEFRAVHVRYTGKRKLKAHGDGVEERVAAAMRQRFGIELDWGVDLSVSS